jgi:hypothetical protein
MHGHDLWRHHSGMAQWISMVSCQSFEQDKKYAPKDRISRVEMKRQLTAVSMGKKEDPHKMLEEFHRQFNLFNDGNVKISDEDLTVVGFMLYGSKEKLVSWSVRMLVKR